MQIAVGMKTVWWKRFCWYQKGNVEKDDIAMRSKKSHEIET